MSGPTRLAGVVAGLLWVAGMVLLVVALRATDDYPGVPDICQLGTAGCSMTSDLPRALIVGTVLSGVAGLLVAGLVPVRRARTTRVLTTVATALWLAAVVLLVVGIRQFAPLGVRLFGVPTLADSLGRLYYGTAAVAAAGLLILVRRRHR